MHHFSIKHLDRIQKLDSTQVRRKSCVCEDCGNTAPKENRLPNQLCEIAYHKQERLADIFLSKLDGARKFMRNDHKKRNFRIYARNPLFILRSQPDMEDSFNLQSTPSRQATPEALRIKTEQPIIPSNRLHKYIPSSNYFLQQMKEQVKRNNKTINKLLTERRQLSQLTSNQKIHIPLRLPMIPKKMNQPQKQIPKQKLLEHRFNSIIREFFNSSKK